MKVSVLHMEIRATLQANSEAAKTAVLKAAKDKPALIALPEYFTVPNCMGDFTDAAKISEETAAKTLEFLQDISKQIGGIYLFGGTVLKKTAANITIPARFGETATCWVNTKKLTRSKLNLKQVSLKAVNQSFWTPI